ncbi:hypothetical protein OF001_U20002 [Pseudomonas sp. OF001]|nr:hypothetical protein OF001_U20002 [Pseudomonas sp. OF001]
MYLICCLEVAVATNKRWRNSLIAKNKLALINYFVRPEEPCGSAVRRNHHINS